MYTISLSIFGFFVVSIISETYRFQVKLFIENEFYRVLASYGRL